MRFCALFCVVILGLFLKAARIQSSCNMVRLDYHNYGELWSVDADNNKDAKVALKFCRPWAFVFRKDTVRFYDIKFNVDTMVEWLRFKLAQVDKVTVAAFGDDAQKPIYTTTKKSGNSRMYFTKHVFAIHKPGVHSIRITWTTDEVKIGMKKLVVFVCPNDDCEFKDIIATNEQLELPTGFGITVPGPALTGTSLNPAQVLLDSNKMITLKSLSSGTNSISMTFDTEVNIHAFIIQLKYAKAVTFQCFADLAATHLIYAGTERLRSKKWNEVEHTTTLGKINKVRRVDINFTYKERNNEKLVFAKDLGISTCE